ncbi:hypothetical protein EBR66_01435 [bacterium]|nr:hypothetical protein [bacterium]
MSTIKTRTHERMKDVLMSPDAPGPEAHYYMISGEGKRPNVTVWETGTVGGEYIKTYGHYHEGMLSDVYEVLDGEGIVLLQKLGNMEGVVEEFRCMPCKKGDRILMPAFWGHVIVNTGKTCLVTLDSSTGSGSARYEEVKRMNGFAYYIKEQNGKPFLVRNPRYTEVQLVDYGGLSHE